MTTPSLRAARPSDARRPGSFPVNVDGTVFRTRWRNKAVQKAFRDGVRAFLRGQPAQAPYRYDVGNFMEADFRRAWMDGYAVASAFAEAARCRVCGCSQHRACAGGCWWVEPELCSACAPKPAGEAP